MNDMTPDEALEIVKEHAAMSVKESGSPRGQQALATLDGLHAHWSRFKVGDDVWTVLTYTGGPHKGTSEVRAPADREYGDKYGRVVGWAPGKVLSLVDDYECAWYPEDEADCFHTRAEAEQECAKRNKEKV
jgi:hypothetical protein